MALLVNNINTKHNVTVYAYNWQCNTKSKLSDKMVYDYHKLITGMFSSASFCGSLTAVTLKELIKDVHSISVRAGRMHRWDSPTARPIHVGYFI